MIGILIGIIVIELLILCFIKKARKYIVVMSIFDITTFLVYLLFMRIFMNIIFLKEHLVFLMDKIVILILSIAVSLLVDTIFVAFLQKLFERKMIHQYEKKYQFDNFEYYRDILKEKSPGILSLCYNARKLNFEDTIVSILLYLKHINMIDMQNNHIKIIGNAKLKNHERVVLDYMVCRYSEKKFKKNFYSALIEDTKKQKYIFTEKDDKVDMTMFAQMIIVIMIIFLLITIPLFVELSSFGIFVFLAYFLCFVSLSIYQFLEKKINLIIRTNAGLELCGKLKGLKRFLKDFSKLSDSELKQMELYEEYVIYGVVLNLKGTLSMESKQLYNNLIKFPKLPIKMHIKRKNYEKEIISKSTLFMLLIQSFYGFIIIILILENAFEGVFVILVLMMFLFIILFIQFYIKRKFKKKRNVIIEHGVKLSGNIVQKYNCVTVKFEYDGRIYQCKTPNLCFSALDIQSDDVDVYYINGYYYVDNFKKKVVNK